DTTAPTITDAGANAQVEGCATNFTPTFTPPTATDCGAAVAVHQVGDDVIGGTACARTYTRTWAATDSCNNTSQTRSQTITLVDTTAPEITAAGADTQVEGCATNFPPHFTPPTATDCGAAVAVHQVGDDVIGGTACARTYPRTGGGPRLGNTPHTRM